MDLRASIINQTDVALVITKQLLLGEGKDLNLVFSPLSIHVVLSMISDGSKGPTLDQLLSFLNFDNGVRLKSFVSELVAVVLADVSHNDGPGPSLSFAEGVRLDRSLSLKPSFKLIMDNVYKAALHQADFPTRVSVPQLTPLSLPYYSSCSGFQLFVRTNDISVFPFMTTINGN